MINNAAMWWWGGVAMAVVAAGGVVWAVGGDWWKTRKLRKAGALRRCRKCLFDMSGLTTFVCPECGKVAKSEKNLRGVKRRWGVAVLAMVILAAAWPVSLMPRLRAGWRPTWYWMATQPIKDVSDPWRDRDGTQLGMWRALSNEYFEGEVTPFDEGVLIASRRLAAMVSRRRAEKVGGTYVESRLSLRNFSQDSEWMESKVPTWDPKAPRSPINGTRPGPEYKMDWTLAKWNRYREFEAFVTICETVILIGEPCGNTDVRYEIDLSNRELVRWGNSDLEPFIAGAAKELKDLLADNVVGRAVGPVKCSTGVIYGDQMIRIYQWNRGEGVELSTEFERLAIEIVKREPVLAVSATEEPENESDWDPYAKPTPMDQYRNFDWFADREGLIVRATVSKQNEIYEMLRKLVETRR